MKKLTFVVALMAVGIRSLGLFRASARARARKSGSLGARDLQQFQAAIGRPGA